MRRPTERGAGRLGAAGHPQGDSKPIVAEHVDIGKQAALARLGEILAAMPKATGGEHGGRHSKDGSRVEPSNPTPAIADLGIDKKVSQ